MPLWLLSNFFRPCKNWITFHNITQWEAFNVFENKISHVFVKLTADILSWMFSITYLSGIANKIEQAFIIYSNFALIFISARFVRHYFTWVSLTLTCLIIPVFHVIGWFITLSPKINSLNFSARLLYEVGLLVVSTSYLSLVCAITARRLIIVSSVALFLWYCLELT